MNSLASATAPDPAARQRDAGLRFVRRMYLPRRLGLALGGVAIASVLWTNGAGAPLWVLLALSALLWPHAAHWIGRRADDPYAAELRNLTLDSALGGMWIALMKFNLLPSVLLLAMLSMDKLAVGGLRLLARCTAALVLAGAAAGLLTGFEIRPVSTMLHVAGSLPLLVVYPLLVGITTYRLARRVRAQNRELAAMSRTDGLTGLLNRRYWDEAVAAEFQRCKRTGRPVSLLMLDIDHFKAVNDAHGHLVGDEVIRAVARHLRSALRLQDLPGRYGGEEFGVVLPDTALEGAEVIAERVRRRIGDAVLEKTGVRATVSIGIAALDPAEPSYADWISQADRALYAAKANGRNRCEAFRRPATSSSRVHVGI